MRRVSSGLRGGSERIPSRTAGDGTRRASYVSRATREVSHRLVAATSVRLLFWNSCMSSVMPTLPLKATSRKRKNENSPTSTPA